MSVLKRYNGTTWETIGPEITSTRFDSIDDMIAPEYSPTETYNVGDYVVQSDHLYKCISVIEEIEEWTPAHWTQVSMSGEVSDLKSAINICSATATTNTASGAIVSFADGADNVPVKKFVVDMEPAQDLHGYDHPWPGGGGKNLHKPNVYSTTGSGVTYTLNADGSIVLNGTATKTLAIPTISVATSNGFFDTIPAGTYIPSIHGEDAVNAKVEVYASDSTLLSSGSAFTINAETEVLVRISTINGNTYSNSVFYLQLEQGSVATDYEPYENICPIAGWTGMTGKRTGKNLAKPRVTTTTSKGVTATLSNGKYIITGTATGGVSSLSLCTGWLKKGIYIYTSGLDETMSTYDTYLVVNGTTVARGNNSSTPGNTFTIAEDYVTFTIMLRVREGVTVNNLVFKQMVRLASDPDDTYEPYTGTDITADWSSVAGTVYGGTLDVTNGVLTVDRAIGDLGNTNWTKGTTGTYFMSNYSTNWIIDPSIIAKPKSGDVLPNLICSMYREETATRIISSNPIVDNVIGCSTNNGRFFIRDSSVDSAEALTAKVTGQKVVAYITPQTYQLTPTEVTTVLGANSIWSDAGDVEVTYRADTTLYIQQLTQPTEDDMTADHAISAGTFFMLGNALYLATSQIAAGGTITPGTNATRLSLADALNQLNT